MIECNYSEKNEKENSNSFYSKYRLFNRASSVVPTKATTQKLFTWLSQTVKNFDPKKLVANSLV